MRLEADVKNMAHAAQLTAVERPAAIPTGFMGEATRGKEGFSQIIRNFFRNLPKIIGEGAKGGVFQLRRSNMTITNEFFGIRCMPNWAQELDPILHRYACPEGTNEYAESDLAAGQMMKAMRGVEARFLNLLLGTDYTDNSLIQANCREAEGGVCVYTRSEGSALLNLDAFRPREGYYVKASYFVTSAGEKEEGPQETFYNENARIAELGIQILRFPVTRWLAEASVRIAGAAEDFMNRGGSRYPREFQTGIEEPIDVPVAAPVVAETHRRRTYREAIARWEQDDGILR